MMNNPLLYRCPYCRSEEGEIWLDSFVCMEARREDPDPRYLDQDRIDDGQSLIRFGSDRENHLPCPHVLTMEMEIDWKLLGSAGDEYPSDEELETPTWKVAVNWTAPSFLKLDHRHTGVWVRDHSKIQSKTPSFMPKAKYRLESLHDEWNVEPDWVTSFESVYAMYGSILVAKRPHTFLSELDQQTRKIV